MFEKDKCSTSLVSTDGCKRYRLIRLPLRIMISAQLKSHPGISADAVARSPYDMFQQCVRELFAIVNVQQRKVIISKKKLIILCQTIV